jgi:hypothetical protein
MRKPIMSLVFGAALALGGGKSRAQTPPQVAGVLNQACGVTAEVCGSLGFLGQTRCDCQAVRFVDNGDGTITDNKTGLTWE